MPDEFVSKQSREKKQVYWNYTDSQNEHYTFYDLPISN